MPGGQSNVGMWPYLPAGGGMLRTGRSRPADRHAAPVQSIASGRPNSTTGRPTRPLQYRAPPSAALPPAVAAGSDWQTDGETDRHIAGVSPSPYRGVSPLSVCTCTRTSLYCFICYKCAACIFWTCHLPFGFPFSP